MSVMARLYSSLLNEVLSLNAQEYQGQSLRERPARQSSMKS